MAKLSIQAGATSVTVNVFLQDSSSSTGAGLTGLAFNTASLTAYYGLPGAAAVAITLATQTVTGAWSSGGFVEISSANMPGFYRLDIPNAALASGRFSSILIKGATNLAPCPIEIALTATNNQDAVTGGMAGIAVMTSGTAQAGAANSITLASTASATNGLYDPSIVLLTGGTGAGQARNILDYVGATKVATVDKTWRTNPDSTSTYIISPLGYTPSVNEGLAQAGAASTVTLNASASATDSTYNGQWVFIRAGTGSDQARMVTGYVGSTKVATVSHAWQTNPDATSVYSMLPAGRVQGVEGSVTGSVASVTGAVGSVTGLTASNLDTTISSRMATYTQPTGFLAATFPTGTVANTTNITAGTIATVTNLTNAPTAGDLTATMKTSVTTAATAATPIAASVTGAVGSVTGLTASDVGAIKTKTDQLTFTAANQIDSNIKGIGDDATALTAFKRAVLGNVIGTCDVGCTTTSIVTSALTPAGAVADQFKGRLVTFDKNTVTAALRGQCTDITSNTSAATPTLTVTALTTAPASGETFTIT